MSNEWKMVPVDLIERLLVSDRGADWANAVCDLQDLPALGPAGDVEVFYMLRNNALRTQWRDAGKEEFDSAAELFEYERRELVDRAHVTRLTAERDDWKARCARRVEDIQLQAQRHEHAQSELIKLRELLSDVAGYTRHPDYDWHDCVKKEVDAALAKDGH